MSTTDTPISHVADTAFLISHYRALESARPDALFRDPFAAKLSGEKGQVIGRAMNREMTAWSVAIRTIIIDDLIREAIATGTDTVLNLGAGLDARPYRLDLPGGLLWIEADYPDVIAYKKSVLAGETPNCKLEQVSIDLSDDQKRREFLSSLPSRAENLLVLTEGVIPYLDNKQVGALADDLCNLAKSTRLAWILEYLPKNVYIHRRTATGAKQMRNAPFKFRVRDWFGFFASHGWHQREIRYLGIEGIKLGRRAPLPWKTRITIRIVRLFRRKRNRGRLERLLGYAILEPIPTPQR
jgi:methyltransferase (TIGR00027 family)